MAPVEFAHPVEQAVADVLDDLGIRWLYEPHTFTLEEDENGNVATAFTPDFYLPEIGVYIECTVAKRKYLNGKRQKVRAARNQHGIICEIAYRDDFERMASRWSLPRLTAVLKAVA